MSRPGSSCRPTIRSASPRCPTAWWCATANRSRPSGSAASRCCCARQTEALLPEHAGLFAGPNLDAFLAAGPDSWLDVRTAVTGWLVDEAYRELMEPLLVPLAGLPTVLPFSVADYVDFYASENHALNASRVFRPDNSSLLPNWKHLPVGYHGRAGTVVVSGTDVRRPAGPAAGRRRGRVRPVPAAGLRGRGRFRGRCRLLARPAGTDRRLRPARLRRGAAQRLVRP